MTAGGRRDEPIACSLDEASFRERAGEWRALVASSVVSVQAVDTAVRLELRESQAALTAAVDLAQREKRCCAFFDVSVVVEADRRTLVLAVPDGAEDVLAAFVALLGSSGR
jgi:anti-sigma-K factor RskA